MSRTFKRTSIGASLLAVVLFVIVLALQTRSTEEVVSAKEAEAVAQVNEELAPALTAVAAKNIRAGSDAQQITFRGRHFVPRMTARLFTPDGFLVAYGPSSVRDVTPTSFTLSAQLTTPGTYTVVSRNPSGRLSNEMTFTVSPPRTSAAQ
jgi:hypothetical protein